MEFTIPAVDEYVDLNRSYFRMRYRLKKADGNNEAAGDKLYSAPNLAHTLIKQMTVNFKSNPHQWSDRHLCIQSYDQQEANCLLRVQGWLGTHTDGSSALEGLRHTLDGQQH